MTPRRLIREAVKAALIGKTIAGNRVESSRPNPLSQQPHAAGGLDELPAIIVYTRSMRSEVFDESPRRYRHEAELVVECALEIQPGTPLDDQMDEFEQQVVDELLLDDTLNGTADDLVLTGSTNTIDGSGNKLLGGVIISLQATFYTYAPVAGGGGGERELPDFNRLHTEYSLNGQQPDPRDRAKTDIEGFPQ